MKKQVTEGDKVKVMIGVNAGKVGVIRHVLGSQDVFYVDFGGQLYNEGTFFSDGDWIHQDKLEKL